MDEIISDFLSRIGTTGLSHRDAAHRYEIYGANADEGMFGNVGRGRGMAVTRLAFALTAVILVFLCGNVGGGIAALCVAVLYFAVGYALKYHAREREKTLYAMSPLRCNVFREGEIIRLHREKIVQGDILILKEGDFVPADAQIILSENLVVDESAFVAGNIHVSKTPGYSTDDPTHKKNRYSENAVRTGLKHSLFEDIDDRAKKDTKYGQTDVVWGGTGIVHGVAVAAVFQTGHNMRAFKDEDGGKARAIYSPSTETEIEKTFYKYARKIQTGIFIALAAALVGVVIPLIIAHETSIAEIAAQILPVSVLGVCAILPDVGFAYKAYMLLAAFRLSHRKCLIHTAANGEKVLLASALCIEKSAVNSEKAIQVTGLYQPYGKPLTLLSTAVMSVLPETDEYDYTPTDKAVFGYSNDSELDLDTVMGYTRLKSYPEIDGLSGNAYDTGDTRILSIKGAPLAIIDLCGKDSPRHKYIFKQATEDCEKGHTRAIAYAYSVIDNPPEKLADMDYRFVGVLCFGMEVKPSVLWAASRFRDAHTSVKIFSDGSSTSVKYIGDKIGLPDKLVKGEEIALATDGKATLSFAEAYFFAELVRWQRGFVLDNLRREGIRSLTVGDAKFMTNDELLKSADVSIVAVSKNTATMHNAAIADILVTREIFSELTDTVYILRGAAGNFTRLVEYSVIVIAAFLLTGIGFVFTDIISAPFALTGILLFPLSAFLGYAVNYADRYERAHISDIREFNKERIAVVGAAFSVALGLSLLMPSAFAYALCFGTASISAVFLSHDKPIWYIIRTARNKKRLPAFYLSAFGTILPLLTGVVFAIMPPLRGAFGVGKITPFYFLITAVLGILPLVGDYVYRMVLRERKVNRVNNNTGG